MKERYEDEKGRKRLAEIGKVKQFRNIKRKEKTMAGAELASVLMPYAL